MHPAKLAYRRLDIKQAICFVFIGLQGAHDSMGLSEGSKARLQLEADFLNTLAGNIAVLGVVAPIISYVFGTALTIDSDLAIGASLVCFAIALALHLTGVARLMRLDK